MDRRPIIILLDSRQLGGIETHIYHLARALGKAGWPAEIWFYQAYSEPHPMAPRLQSEGITFRYLQGTFTHLLSTLKNNPPLILHTHGYKAGIVGRLTARLCQIPVVSTFHNADPGRGIIKLYYWLDRVTSRLSSNIAVSSDIARTLKIPPVPINNFIDVPSHPVSSGTLSAFVGRLSIEKGPDQFLQLAKHQPDMSFRLYGTGPMERDLDQQAPDNVRLMGQVSGMNQHWQDIGQLCITSRHEGLPMVALEAMAQGIPVFCFHLGALPQLIRQGVNGWIAPLGDIRKMSEQLLFWHQLPESRKNEIRQHCINTVKSAYSYQAVLPKILNVYQSASKQYGQDWPEIPSAKPVLENMTSGDGRWI